MCIRDREKTIQLYEWGSAQKLTIHVPQLVCDGPDAAYLNDELAAMYVADFRQYEDSPEIEPQQDEMCIRDSHGVVLHPALLRIDLLKLALLHRNAILLIVEQDGTAAGGSLIQRQNIFCCLFYTSHRGREPPQHFQEIPRHF